MLGLLLFINALAVLIICARMHDCHVYTDTVSPVILIRIIEKKTHWKLDRPIISKLVLLYVSHTWRVVLSLMIDSLCRCAIIRCHMAGEYRLHRPVLIVNTPIVISSKRQVLPLFHTRKYDIFYLIFYSVSSVNFGTNDF